MSRPAPPPPSRFALPRSQRGLLGEAARARLLEGTRAILETPTAPYAEDLQIAGLRARFDRRAGFDVRLDEHANLIVAWKGAEIAGREPPLAFSAHLDHPGFLYEGRSGRGHRASFHGGVPEELFRGAAVRFFDVEGGEACATARVRRVERTADGDRQVELERFAGTARAGMFGMWDLTAGWMRGARLASRACDDLLGAAAIAGVLEMLAEERSELPCLGLFTRAEETGFVGCQGLLRSGALSAATRVIGLECSPRRHSARIGRGPVVRVGDAASVFDAELTHRLQEAAAGLRQAHPGLEIQRALMDGGRCESSAYNLWNVRAGGLCLALGNYHNCGARGAIAPEYVDWNDFEGLVALMLAVARSWESSEPARRMLERLDGAWERESERLRRSSARILKARVGSGLEARS